MEKIAISFLQYKNLIITAILVFLLLFIILRISKINIKNSKKIFPLLSNIKNLDAIRLSLLLFKTFVIIYLALSHMEITFSILLIFIIVDSIYNISRFAILSNILDYINSIFIFTTLFLNKIIDGYITTTKYNDNLLIINVLITIFLVMYSIWMFNLKLLKIKR